MLASGLFVPALRVECGHCRVNSYATPERLGTTMACDFCGEDFSLALSHSLAKPHWRYQLASHLRPDQVESLLPALATCSLLGQMRLVEEPQLPMVLGLEVSIGRRKAEVDVAAFVPDYDWLAVLTEVKHSNRVDLEDVANLEWRSPWLTDTDAEATLVVSGRSPDARTSSSGVPPTRGGARQVA